MTLLAPSAVQRYIHEGASEGRCRINGTKVASRAPWYRVPLPKPAHAFLSGMTTRGPWLAINEFTNVQATNTLYVVRFRSRVTMSRRFAWAIALQTTQVRSAIMARGRRYGQGLLKFEPGDFRDVLVPVPPNGTDARSSYAQIVRKLVAGETDLAQDLADKWFEKWG